MTEFEIRAPRFVLTIFKIFLWLGIISLIIITLLAVFKIIPWELIAFISLSILSIFLGLLGIYTWHNEVFILKNSIFTYIKPFKKNQSAKVKDVDHVVMKRHGILLKVIFIDKYGKELINFLDDGTAFKDGLFLKSLEENNIIHVYIGFDE